MSKDCCELIAFGNTTFRLSDTPVEWDYGRNGGCRHCWHRTFVRLRELLATHQDIARKVKEHDRQIATLLRAVEKLLALREPKTNPIGYIHPKE